MSGDQLGPYSMQTEELESLQAIYCNPDEFQCWKVSNGQHVTIQFELNLPHGEKVHTAGIRVLLPPNYPFSVPEEMTVFCNGIPATRLSSIRQKMEERAENLKGEPMILNLLLFIQELLEASVVINDDADGCDKLIKTDCVNSEINESGLTKTFSSQKVVSDNHTADLSAFSITQDHYNLPTQKSCSTEEEVNISCESRCNIQSDDDLTTALLQLDHMRSKQNYVKLIQKWTAELGLNGRLLFYGKFIFIILQGHSHQVKEYIVRNKTMIVDVDSKGRPCKERMLSVLCQLSSHNFIRFKDFVTVSSISSLEDFSAMFQSFSMTDVFTTYIEPPCAVKAKRASVRK